MVRKKDTTKINKIVKVLLKYPDGVWIRQISKESNIAASTVHFYVENILGDIVDNIGVKNKEGKYFGVRVVRLKPKIKETVEREGLNKVYKYLKMYDKI